MKFLVAVDGSAESYDALRHALTIAERSEATVTVVHAVDPDVYEVGGMEPITELGDADDRLLVESIEDAEQRGTDVLEEAAEIAAERGLTVETDLLYGPPVPRIVECAERNDVDNVFVGHRGMTDRLEALLGSVAKRVVERSSVPVTVVH
ncbi:MAG: universal stress protein [Halanaeroarchaeum sp.]